MQRSLKTIKGRLSIDDAVGLLRLCSSVAIVQFVDRSGRRDFGLLCAQRWDEDQQHREKDERRDSLNGRDEDILHRESPIPVSPMQYPFRHEVVQNTAVVRSDFVQALYGTCTSESNED